MSRLRIAIASVGFLALVGAGPAAPAPESGTVTRVVSGDTVVVRLAARKLEHVRLLGVDAPDGGSCWAADATAATRRIALGRKVMLLGDAAQKARDGRNRLLAYLTLPGGRDLGLALLQAGHAVVWIDRRPFAKLKAYRVAEKAGKSKGLWTCGASRPKPGPKPVAPAPVPVKDTTPPTMPGPASGPPPLTASPITTLTLHWRVSTDDFGVTGYTVYLNDVAVGEVAASAGPILSYTFTNFACGQTHKLGVVAFDAAGNRSDQHSRNDSTSPCRPPPTLPA